MKAVSVETVRKSLPSKEDGVCKNENMAWGNLT